jgi:hypothetical protein
MPPLLTHSVEHHQYRFLESKPNAQSFSISILTRWPVHRRKNTAEAGERGVTRWPAVVEGASVGAGPVGILGEVAPQLLPLLPPLVPRRSRRGVRPCPRLRRHRRKLRACRRRWPGRTTAAERRPRAGLAGEWRRVLRVFGKLGPMGQPSLTT